MLTFSQFIEIVDTEPSQISWDSNCVFRGSIKDFKGERQSRHTYLSRLNYINQTTNHTGCFTVGGHKYVLKIDVSPAHANKRLLVVKGDYDLSNYISKDSLVAEVEFSRIKDDSHFIGIDSPWGKKLTANLGQVFSTVLDGVKYVLTKHPVDIILFESWASTRTRFYKSMISRFGMGYKLVNFDTLNADRDTEGNYKVANTLFMLVKEKLGDRSRYEPKKAGIANDFNRL